jgi:signal transduction histidine kinase
MTHGSVSDVMELFKREIALEATGTADPERPILIETNSYRKDGSIIQVRNSVRFLRDANGHPCGILGVSSDISERKKAEEAIRQANRKLKLLSGITRHDINNQLTVLIGNLRVISKKQPEIAQNEYLLKASTAAQRISAMIRFTKEYEEIGVNAPAWQDCNTLVDTAAKEVPLGKVRVTNDLSPGMEVFADPLIIKVFYNLIDNAVRYGGKIAMIRFSSMKHGDDHLIICEDDGEGVPLDEKETIFERGFGKNTGLGLALSQEILDITGITICENGEPGKGARFEILVPKGFYRVTTDTHKNQGTGP